MVDRKLPNIHQKRKPFWISSSDFDWLIQREWLI